ncbi:MAG: hypothetical protein HOV80_00055 [Polyangiaceae bacterium]|nr:hypothetical protein [Polyangiaceae bacterium]
MRARGATAALAFVAAMTPRDALACWCGYSGSIGNVTVTERLPNADYCPPAWEPANVRAWATELSKLDALLPPGLAIDAADGVAVLSIRLGDFDVTLVEQDWDGDVRTLFDHFAWLRNDSSVREARRARPVVFTVQAVAATDAARAEAVVVRMREAEVDEDGFFWAGDAPAINDPAHVVVEPDARGRKLHKVLTGSYLDLAEARAAAKDIEKKTGLDVFVRRL